MKAVVYTAARNYQISEVPTPQAGPSEVRIKITPSRILRHGPAHPSRGLRRCLPADPRT